MDDFDLKENEYLYRTIFEKIDATLMIIELLYDEAGTINDYKFKKVNSLFEKHTGLKNVNLIGKTCKQVFPNLEFSWLTNYDEVNKTDKSKQYIKFGELTKRWYYVYCFPYGNGIVGVQFRDITEEVQIEKALHKSEERYNAFMTASFDNIYQYSSDFSQFNMLKDKGGFSDLKISNSNMIKKHIHPDDWDYIEDGINKVILNKSILDLEHRFLDEDGSYIWKHSRVVPIINKDGTIVEWIGASRDITDRKLIEEALQESERKAQELIIELRKADEQKNNFISTLSHELRNPLAAITMGLSLMEHVPPGSEEDIGTRKAIHRQTAQLIRLVNDLLETTRVNRNKLKLIKEKIEVNAIIKETLEEYHVQFEGKGVALEGEYYVESIHFNADPVRIKQVIGNLLSNSLKFTEKGGKVKLTVSKVDDEVVIVLTDTGVGIAHEHLTDVFEAFIQADNSLDRSAGGIGLGLCIVKGIIDLHGGSIIAKSEGLGKGSQFIIRLPLWGQ